MQADDFYVLDDFVILDMAVDAYAQIIRGRPFLATFDCKIDEKGGRVAFDVGECHVQFSLFENQKFPFSFIDFRRRFSFS